MKKEHNIALISMGGTIVAKSVDSKKYISGKTNINDILIQTGFKKDNVITLSLFFDGSQNLELDDLFLLAKCINSLIINGINQKKIHAIVITHGSDTLEETAFFLGLLFRFPIILTASMRSPESLSSDVFANINQALNLAKKNINSVFFVANNEIHNVVDIMKFHTNNLNSFQSLNFGLTGYILYDEVQILHNRKLFNFDINLDIVDFIPKVGIIFLYIGFNFEIEIFKNYDALVIVGFGNGNLPKKLLYQIKILQDAGVFIIVSSRCPSGPIIKNVEIHHSDLSLFTFNFLTPFKARIFTILALIHIRQKYLNEDKSTFILFKNLIEASEL